MPATHFRLHVVLSVALGLGCADTGQGEVAYPAFATATGAEAFDADGWTVTLDEARVAFGPVTFCAARSGSATLCETAIGEIADVVLIDATMQGAAPLGTVQGLAGEIRSASFDYGIHWFTTEVAPTADPRAPGGHSAHFSGRAVRDGDEVRFVADVDALPQFRGQRAAPTAPAGASIGEGDSVRLDVHFDAAAWVSQIDFEELLETAGDGAIVGAGSTPHDALVIAMVATHPPTFAWTVTPESEESAR